MVRDLRFAWEEMPQQMLDEQKQKVRESLPRRADRLGAERGRGRRDYTDNVPLQCLHPVGHWYEVPNLLRNGVLRGCSPSGRSSSTCCPQHRHARRRPRSGPARPAHRSRVRPLTFEVIGRRIDDRGGGLARVDGRSALVEGLAMPREEDEFDLSYYNSLTTWVDIDGLLARLRPDARRPRATPRRWPPRSATWPRACRPTSRSRT